jgi:hypothetical protein
MATDRRQTSPHPPLAARFDSLAGKRLLWVAVGVMLAFGAAELPALGRMSSHGTGVLGLEFAGSTGRLREILSRWGSAGVAAARDHVLIDVGFIVGYGVLLVGVCGRLTRDFARRGRGRAAALAALLAWAALSAAAVNLVQKVLLWIELHGHTAQPLPALVAACATITFGLAVPAALFALLGGIALHRSPAANASRGQLR